MLRVQKAAGVPNDIATLAPAALLKRFEDEVLVTEVVHNFCATSETDGKWGTRCVSGNQSNQKTLNTQKKNLNPSLLYYIERSPMR